MSYIELFNQAKLKIQLGKELAKQFNPILSPNFNAFDFVELSENKISEILSFLLDPNASHGQGDTFLQIFFKLIDVNFPFINPTKIIAKTEHTTRQGKRIDILITDHNYSFVLAIENKIYLNTIDQKNQVIDYIQYLESVTKNFVIIYLAPDGNEISDDSISKELREHYLYSRKLIHLTYQSNLVECISEFKKNTVSDRVRFFLSEFEAKLKSIFMGSNQYDSITEIIKHATLNEQNLEAALQISIATNTVKEEIKKRIPEIIDEVGKELAINTNDYKLYPTGWAKYSIFFNFESGGLLYGIVKIHAEDAKGKTFLPKLQENIGGHWSTSHWCPLWNYMYTNIANNTAFYLEINNGEFKRKAKEFVSSVISAINSEEIY